MVLIKYCIAALKNKVVAVLNEVIMTKVVYIKI